MLIDHLVYAAPDLDAAIADLENRLGVRAEFGGRHEGFGTHNALLALGASTYLELIAPDPGQPATPRPFGLDDADRRGLVAWAISTHDIRAAIADARGHGYDPGDAVAAEREAPAGRLSWRLTLNAIAGGPLPFLIDWGDTPHPAGSAPQGLRLDAFRIEHPDPDALVPALEALDAEVEVTRAPAAALVAEISGPLGKKELR